MKSRMVYLKLITAGIFVSVGISILMIVTSFFNIIITNDVYSINELNESLDWLMLLILGICLFCFSFYGFVVMKNKEEERQIEKD
jgi:amino acid transporter